jgi:hypothetical protein
LLDRLEGDFVSRRDGLPDAHLILADGDCFARRKKLRGDCDVIGRV